MKIKVITKKVFSLMTDNYLHGQSVLENFVSKYDHKWVQYSTYKVLQPLESLRKGDILLEAEVELRGEGTVEVEDD